MKVVIGNQGKNKINRSPPLPFSSPGDLNSPAGLFFFFVYSYSHATYIDHGGVHFTQVSRPLSARWRHVASSPFALRPGLSQRIFGSTPRKLQKKDKGENKGTRPQILLLVRRRHEGGVGRNSGGSPQHPIPPRHPAPPPPPPAPGVPGAPTLTPHFRHQPLPAAAPAFPHP